MRVSFRVFYILDSNSCPGLRAITALTWSWRTSETAGTVWGQTFRIQQKGEKKGRGARGKSISWQSVISQGNDDEAISLDQWLLTFGGSCVSGIWLKLCPSNILMFISAFLLHGTFLLHETQKELREKENVSSWCLLSILSFPFFRTTFHIF